jgi:hypothetical protein
MSTAVAMRALTIRQPYADAIVHVDHPRWGRKPIENRSWPIPPALIGTRIMIHAGKAADRRALAAGILPGPDARGAVIGTAWLAGCHFDSVACRSIRGGTGCGPWAELDVFHWFLDDVQALPEPVPVNGLQKLWTPAEAVQQAVRDQQAAVLRCAADLLDDGAPTVIDIARDIPGCNEAVSRIDGAVANLMRTSAFALENDAEFLDTPRLLTEAHRITTATVTITGSTIAGVTGRSST